MGARCCESKVPVNFVTLLLGEREQEGTEVCRKHIVDNSRGSSASKCSAEQTTTKNTSGEFKITKQISI
jgi:hypothetical protein